jgi:hypothetical protein
MKTTPHSGKSAINNDRVLRADPTALSIDFLAVIPGASTSTFDQSMAPDVSVAQSTTAQTEILTNRTREYRPPKTSKPEVLALSRRSTPERLDAAREAGVRNRLITEDRISEERADEWIARWHEQAAHQGRQRDGAYWDAAYEWIAAKRR